MNFLNGSDHVDGIYILTEPQAEFENHYLQVREKEKRILSDEIVAALPRTPPSYIHHSEWKLREASSKKVLTYLKNTRPKTALDIGCGNGWFTNKLASVSENVIGLDMNLHELKQANRVFEHTNLTFCYADIFSEKLPHKTFDLITINAAIQYFPDAKQLFNQLLELLSDNGEIHIIDSPFYPKHELVAAKERTAAYFDKMECPEMANSYFHHSWSVLDDFNHTVMFDPSTLTQRAARKLGFTVAVFPWIVVRK